MPSPTLTDEQKSKIRHHLGYLGVAEVSSFVFGTPASLETQFIIEGAMKRLLPETLPLVVDFIEKCDATEAQYFENAENLAVSKVGSIELRADEGQQLMGPGGRYDYWRRALANALGCAPNPFDKRPGLGVAGAGVNIPVIG
jgi:hypothetical protein